MKKLIACIKQELLKLQEARVKYEQALAGLPEGKLKANNKGGRKYYFLYSGGVETYIGRNRPELVKSLKNRRFAEEMLERIDGNEACLMQALATLRSIAPEDIYKNLPKSYQSDEDDRKFCGTEADAEAWGNATYVKKQTLSRYDQPSQRTAKGENVRSKSELIIANMLWSKKIPYHYEEELWLGDISIAPDFTVLRKSDGKLLFLEHIGMMHDPGYRSRFAQKVYTYLKSGYMPYRDVFFTFDDLNGNIDSRFLDYLIEEHFR